MTTAPTPPMIIAGRYQVIRQLGQGTFGQVLEVHDHTLGTVCALKLLDGSIGVAGPWAESQILRGLRGEYILPILNADLVAGSRYVVTEVMTGGTVDDHIVPNVGMPVGQAVRWAREACHGIARVHDSGLIHGDIKPANLFLDNRGEVLVGDFGLAQQLDENGVAGAGGTPGTMAPEVAASLVPLILDDLTYTVLSDVYSLGATLFWMLAGAPVTQGMTSLHDIATHPRPDIWDQAPHVPRGLRTIVNKAISFDPALRPTSAAELASQLGRFREGNRSWDKISPHAGHEQCFRGTKGESVIELCAEPESLARVNITARQAGSGRRVRRAERTSDRASLPAALRAAFRACN